MAKYDQRARIRAVNRPKSKDFRENPPLIDRRWAFFLPAADGFGEPGWEAKL
jgi:hypothetical protein